MISRQDIARLAPLESDDGVVSAYIKIDPRIGFDRHQAVNRYKGAAKVAARRLDNEVWLAALEREGERILGYLEGWKPDGRGLVIFSSQPGDIWEVFSLEIPVPNFVDVDSTTKTQILTRLLDEFPRLVVAVVQRDQAQLYVSEQRVLDAGAEVQSDVPGQHSSGGWSQARWERHIDAHMEGHLKQVVHDLKELAEERPFRRLVVAGTEETVSEFLRMLPDSMSEKVIGRLSVDFKHQADHEILEEAGRVQERHERAEEKQLVEQIVNAVKSGGEGALGVDAVLDAINQDKVRTLAIVEGVEIKGSLCEECGYINAKAINAKALEQCPFCYGTMVETNLVDRAVERAFLASAHIETVYGDAEKQLLEEGKGFGSLLRY